MESIRNLHMQQRQHRRSTQELNQTTPSVHQTTRIQANQEEANLITFSPVVEQQVPLIPSETGIQEQPKHQRSPRKKKSQNGHSIKDNLITVELKRFHIFYLVNN